MATMLLNVYTDSEIETKAQEIFASQGLDMAAAINLFLVQTVNHNCIPFTVSTDNKTTAEKREAMFGCLRGRYDIADDFDESLDDFKEYMP